MPATWSSPSLSERNNLRAQKSECHFVEQNHESEGDAMIDNKRDFVETLNSGNELAFGELYSTYYRKCDYILRNKYGMYDRKSHNPDGTRHVYFENLRKDIIQETFIRVITYISYIGDTPIARFIFMHLRSSRVDMLKKEVHLPELDRIFKRRSKLKKRITRLSKLTTKYMTSNIAKDKIISTKLQKALSKLFNKLSEIDSYIDNLLGQLKTTSYDRYGLPEEHNIYDDIERNIRDSIVRKCIEKVLEIMPRNYADIVRSIYFDECTYSETAERFECTIYRVRTAVSMFREELKKQLPKREDLL